MERAAKEKGSSFSATVIDMLEHGSVVVIAEGREIAALLFEINQQLREGCDAGGGKIRMATDRLVDVVEGLYERYLNGGKVDGDR